MNVQTNEPVAVGGLEGIATLEDLGRYLRGLREQRRVTQESLSTRTGAFAPRKIARSRISEIENAKRDRVTERELRTYLCGLKYTPRHIDQIVAVLIQCTATPAREFPAGPDVTGPSSAALEALPASLPQPARHRPRRHRIVLATVLAQVVVALVGMGVGFFLRGESGSRPTSPSGHSASSVPHSTLSMAPDAVDVINAATFPGGTLVPVNQRSPATGETRNWLASRGDATGRDATGRAATGGDSTQCAATQGARTQPLIAAVSAAPCGVGLAERFRPGPVLRGHDVASYRRRTGADSATSLPEGPLGELGMGAW